MQVLLHSCRSISGLGRAFVAGGMLAVVLAGAERSFGTVISNGSFELPVVTGDRITVGPGGYLVGASGWQETALPGDNGSNVYSNATNGWVVPSAGHQILALDNFAVGGVQQVIATTAGLPYVVTFAYSAIAMGDNSTQQLTYEIDNGATPINAAGTPLPGASGTLSINTAGYGGLQFPPYVTESVSFIATGSSSTVRFLALTAPGNAYGPVVDNVSIVPEPGTWVLLGIGVLGLAALRKRRR